MSFSDPVDPPEGGQSMKAADLQNKVCLFRPTGTGEWPAKEARVDEQGKEWKAQGPQPYIECDVWVLDRAGILEEGTGVRVSWWKVVKQLEAVEFGEFVLGMPRKEDDSNAIVLIKTAKDEWRDIGARVVKEIDATATVVTEREPGEDDAALQAKAEAEETAYKSTLAELGEEPF
jgi:hypothetical protein